MEDIGKTYEPFLPTQLYVQERIEASQNLGSVTRFRAKAQMEETSESKEEESEALTKKGIKPNKYYREQETAKEEEEGKKTSLDHLVKPFLSKKKT